MDLESAVRDAVDFRDSLFIITGTLYEGAPRTLPKPGVEPHRVPSGYYKIVYDANGNAAGFIMQQSAGRNDNFCTKQKTVAEIQVKLTTYTLPSLSDSTAIVQRLGC